MSDDDLDQVWRRARARWPTVPPLDRGVFLAWLTERASPGTAVSDLPTDDLYLACACASGDAAALEVFEATQLREVDIAAAKLRAGPDIADEARQVVRALLFVPEHGRAPAIVSYAGRGDLRGWIRVVAMREVLRLCERGKREVPTDDEALLDALSPATDPALEQLKAECRAEFVQAFAGAVHGLSERDRALLRLNIIEGNGVEALGRRYGVHHATAARWLISAREQLLEGTRARLASKLRLSGDEVDSVIRLVRSRVEVSLERLLDG